MTKQPCPVHRTLVNLRRDINRHAMAHPRDQRMAEEAAGLLEDLSWGAAGPDHIPALEGIARQLEASVDGVFAQETGERLSREIRENREAFQSHEDTRNCPTGQCVNLTPAPCQMACPAGIDVPTYVSLIGEGRFADAVEVIRRDNPFPWVCGLVCTRPCELMCVRGRIDNPVAIKPLKAFAAERALSEHTYKNPEKNPPTGKKICVIGAGPAGMTAAYYLALMGHGVKVFEKLPMAGGMLMVGIPRYRLPREVIDREVAMLRDLGVEFEFNSEFGRKIHAGELKKQGFGACFIAIGAHQAWSLGVPGESGFPQVISAVSLLREVALGDRRLPGKRAVVIGGGNVAIDAARTLLRLGAEEVILAYRRDRDSMPADMEEVEQAEEEGVRFDFLTIPLEVMGEKGRLTGLKCQRAEMVRAPDGERGKPLPVEGAEFILNVDLVIPAIGQKIDQECLAGFKGIDWTRRRTLCVNTVTMETDMPGVFAAGDAVTGPATVIEAIGGGKKAALAIDRYLEGLPQPKTPTVPKRRAWIAFREMPAAEKMHLRRPEMPLLQVDRRRTTFQQAELGFSMDQAKKEAGRCLRCDICRRCGKCVEVCRDRMGVNALALGYFDFDHPVATDFRKVAERCILCGACAANCTNGAMVMEEKDGERVLSLCGIVLHREKTVSCEKCGASLGPARYLEFIRHRTRATVPDASGKKLCGHCARQAGARPGAEHEPS